MNKERVKNKEKRSVVSFSNVNHETFSFQSMLTSI